MNSGLVIGTSAAGDQRTLTVKGELDMAVSTVFEQTLLEAVAATQPGAELAVDLSEVRFFDVKALRALLHAARAAEAAGVPFCLAASPTVARVFELLGIDTAPVPTDSTSAPSGQGPWITILPGTESHTQRSRSAARHILVTAAPATGEGGRVDAVPGAIRVQQAAGILAELEAISPGDALERMRARASRDGVILAVLARRIVKYRGWPPRR
ncbi:MAG TPA: STAS domain-containing protein [Actinocrinis sp.]|uniref:STAS domain-containing protein n=1 Tax=Actinocrinis sp. TaxID=1920516 RepID=UPI002D24334C|nr:STAS domain-containing protein [Actinocrinis sp.]HZU58440.1 STAS domain-containing protein [Actinocrinis sp.]